LAGLKEGFESPLPFQGSELCKTRSEGMLGVGEEVPLPSGSPDVLGQLECERRGVSFFWSRANNSHPALYTKKYATKARKNNF
jgi:hypothetical protein